MTSDIGLILSGITSGTHTLLVDVFYDDWARLANPREPPFGPKGCGDSSRAPGTPPIYVTGTMEHRT